MVRSLRLRNLVPLTLLAAAACGTENGASTRSLGTSREELKSCGGPNFVEGIDVSHYETVDFAKVKASGVAFAIMKATEGTGYVDPTFATYYADAKANGLVRGAYHFHRASSDPKQQIDHFLSKVSPTAGDLPLILDVEDVSSGLSASAITANVLACLQYLEQQTGRKPMMYTGMWYWSGNMNNPLGFDKYPLWMSAYPASWASAQNHSACPTIPNDFPGWVMWQYSDGSQADAPSVAGVGKSCDRNFFNGTLGELLAFASTGATGTGGSSGAGGSGSSGSTGVGAGGSSPAGTYAAKYVKQSWPLSSDPAIQMKVGDTKTGSIDMKNTGTLTWPAGVVKLAPIPRDKASLFQSPSWLSANRVSAVSADVAPGQVGHFEWDLTASAAGDFSPYFGLVADGMVWFADSGGPQDNDIQVHVVVAPGPATGAGGSSSVGAGGAAASAGGSAMGVGAGPGAGGKGVGGGASVGAGGAGVGAGGAASAGGSASSLGGASASIGGGGKSGVAGASSAKGGAVATAGAAGSANPSNVVDSAAPGSTGGCSTSPRAPASAGAWLAFVGLGVLAQRRRRARTQLD